MSRRAIILAGGRGTRLRPYTNVLPKPMMPIGDYPIVEVVVRQLARAGFSRITMAVNHQAELIKAFFGDGARWGTAIDYALEPEPLGTMGPVRRIADLPEHFLVMNGDVLTDLDYARFHDAHVADDRIFTVSSYSRTHRIDYGVLDVDGARNLAGFREKPSAQYEVSMGIYMMSQRAAALVPVDTAYGFDQLMLRMLAEGRRVAVERYAGYWLDIGRPDDYEQAIAEFDAMQGRFLDG